jgi:hypothetical protein
LNGPVDDVTGVASIRGWTYQMRHLAGAEDGMTVGARQLPGGGNHGHLS